MGTTLVMISTLTVLSGCAATATTDCPPPRRPGRVPPEAVWKGSCDGGNWVELVATQGKKMRFRIYEARRGKLLLDADFEHRDCNGWRLTDSDWAEHVQSFGYALELAPESDTTRGPRCRLEPVYPAYQPTE
jgi:hypothetical protein